MGPRQPPLPWGHPGQRRGTAGHPDTRTPSSALCPPPHDPNFFPLLQVNPHYEGTFVFPNDFPALQPDSPAPGKSWGDSGVLGTPWSLGDGPPQLSVPPR